MKVLKKGRPQKGWAKEFECSGRGNGNGGCGALLLVEHDDLYLTHHYDYGGGHDTFRTFRWVRSEAELADKNKRLSKNPICEGMDNPEGLKRRGELHMALADLLPLSVDETRYMRSLLCEMRKEPFRQNGYVEPPESNCGKVVE